MLADSHSCIGGMIKFHTLNDVTSNGSSKNDHNMLRLASLKNFHIWKFLNILPITHGHTVHGALHCS